MVAMSENLCIAGAGIGGLAASVAASRLTHFSVNVYEQTAEFSEVGAGVQLGPNVTRVLHRWGLSEALRDVAAFPSCLKARSMKSGEVLGSLPLGADMQTRYGAPYVTVHRADLHGLLLKAAQQQGVNVHLGRAVKKVSIEPESVRLQLGMADAEAWADASALVVADGVWSELRQTLLNDDPPKFSGQTAYRALLVQSELPAYLRSQDVTVWMGRQSHVVAYPVRGGDYLNVVCLVHETHDNLEQAKRGAYAELIDLLNVVPKWTLWPLYARPPMRGAHEHARGCVALLGDAAHPMLPYLAQGAGMAIEDAENLGIQLASSPEVGIANAFRAYAQARWRRNARVQARAQRNGQIFHASGPLQWGRDIALRLRGPQFMDLPWLYAH